MHAPSRRGATIPWVARVGCALSVAGLVMELMSGPGYRLGWWGLGIALMCFGVGGIFATLGCGASIVALFLGRALPAPGAGAARAGAVLGILPAVLFVHLVYAARSSPSINDVSTDLLDPPAFVAAAGAFPTGFADSVRRGYPDLRPLALGVGRARTFGLARTTAAGQRGWVVTAADSEDGRLEATATTRWFGFRDDVVIRVRARGPDSSVVDMRSKSRVGRGDLGTNATRLRKYFAALQRAASR